MLQIGKDASWSVDVLPAALVSGARAALVATPLTSAVLGSAPDRLAGAASDVHNAVARAAGLLSVAVIPGLAGISSNDYADPTTFGAGFRTAILIAASLLVGAVVLAVTGIKSQAGIRIPSGASLIEVHLHCPSDAPAPRP